MLPYVLLALTSGYRTEIPLLPLSERDSPRDQLVVTIFLLTVFGLLLGAGIKARMVKAGFDTSLTWSTGRRWWEVSHCQSMSHGIIHR